MNRSVYECLVRLEPQRFDNWFSGLFKNRTFIPYYMRENGIKDIFEAIEMQGRIEGQINSLTWLQKHLNRFNSDELDGIERRLQNGFEELNNFVRWNTELGISWCWCPPFIKPNVAGRY